MSVQRTPRHGAERTNPLAERLFRDALGMFDLLTMYLGVRLGLYESLAESGWTTSTELAERTGTFERYVREWLEQQTVSGILEVEDPEAEALARRYRVPPAHVEVLVDTGSLNYEAYKSIELVRGARPLPQLVEAFRTGAGLPPLPWEPEGRAEFNRARFVNLLGKVWLPLVPDLDARLRSDPSARVADLGCGTGWASVAAAVAYPKITVDGFDLDQAAVNRARENADSAGVADRVSFFVQDVAELEGAAVYDLVIILEALHDMARPVDALRIARSLLAGGGSVVVADELVGDRFAVSVSDQERYMFGWSVVGCLPEAMGEPGSAGTGAVMRPDTVRRYADEAGFGRFEILPIETNFWRFYRLRS
ncbi:MAG TPA: class I SAM-dependent methyltransferase [Actinomycetota bacterium]|nr:class I SAM-dependent methyltransferase [Actinomycetota bacterium]